jgi:hypothetical protein
MPVISPSALVDESALTLRYTVGAMTVTMFLGHYHKHDWWGFVRIWAGYVAFTLIVMQGADVLNPLDQYTLADYDAAARIQNIIYPVLCFFFCWIGFIFHKILSNLQLWQFFEKLPYPLRSQEKPALVVLPDGSYTVRNLVHDRNAPDRNFGVVGLTQSWLQAVLTFLVFLAAVAPQAVYDYYTTKTGQENMAYGVIVACPAGVLALFTAFCYWAYTDAGTFGLTKRWLLAHNDVYKLAPEQLEMIDADTKRRVLWALLPNAAFTLFGNAALGGWRLVDPDADRMWLGAVGLWGLYALILLVVVMSLRPASNPFLLPGKSTRAIDDSQGYVEQMAARTAPTTSALEGLVQRFTTRAASDDRKVEMKALTGQHVAHW